MSWIPVTQLDVCRSGVRLTEEETVRCCAWWAARLALDHWAIDIQIARGYALGSSYGDIHHTLKSQRATIRVLDPNDLVPSVDPIDMEKTVVHELLHLHLASVAAWLQARACSDIEDAVCLEQPIERLACVLVAMRRSSRDPAVRMSWDAPEEDAP